MAFPRLFSPLVVGPVTLANRVVFAAHLTNYAEDGRPSPRQAAYYGARAAGGAGLVITEEHSVHPSDWAYEKLVHGWRPEVVPAYRQATAAVHAHGAAIFAQLNHNGAQGTALFSRLPLWAPSPVADPLFGEVPQEMGRAELAELVAGYAQVAGHCRAGGFDGVELQCSHSSILRAFLSPLTNRRADAYGGSPAARARLLLHVVDAVRQAIGPDLALGVRLCGDELAPGGTALDDAVEVARRLEAQGATDYLSTSIGLATSSLFMVEASMRVPPGYALFVASALRRAVGLPVVGIGRLKTPAQAEAALAGGHCDLVGVVRGQLADPEWAAKARAGRPDQIRLCLSCNQECVGRIGTNRVLGCIENPAAGHEHQAPARSVARRLRRRLVVVIGAGPGGLQAALAAAGCGHRVVVLERLARPGGSLGLAALAPGRGELGDLVANQVRDCARLGVEVRYGIEAGAASLAGAGNLLAVAGGEPDLVVVATGASPARPPWAGPGPAGDGPEVIDVVQVLDGSAAPGGRVLVVDEIGFHPATSVAELLAEDGCQVEVVTPAMAVAQDLGLTLDLEHWHRRAGALGIAQTTDVVVTGIDRDGVSLLHHPSGRTARRQVDWVVSAWPPAPRHSLYFELRALWAGQADRVRRVGDCVAPRRAHSAVIEGQRAGAGL